VNIGELAALHEIGEKALRPNENGDVSDHWEGCRIRGLRVVGAGLGSARETAFITVCRYCPRPAAANPERGIPGILGLLVADWRRLASTAGSVAE
jgi:hypothetical protein